MRNDQFISCRCFLVIVISSQRGRDHSLACANNGVLARFGIHSCDLFIVAGIGDLSVNVLGCKGIIHGTLIAIGHLNLSVLKFYSVRFLACIDLVGCGGIFIAAVFTSCKGGGDVCHARLHNINITRDLIDHGNFAIIAAVTQGSDRTRLNGQLIDFFYITIGPIDLRYVKGERVFQLAHRQCHGVFGFLILAVRLGCGRDGRGTGAENGHFALGGNGSNLLFTACITYGDALQRGLLGKGEEEAAVPKHLGKPRLRESESAGALFLQDIGGNLNGLVCAHRYIGQGIVLILLHLRNHQRVGGGVVHSFHRGCEGLVCLGGIDLFRILLIGQRDLRRYAIG